MHSGQLKNKEGRQVKMKTRKVKVNVKNKKGNMKKVNAQPADSIVALGALLISNQV